MSDIKIVKKMIRYNHRGRLWEGVKNGNVMKVFFDIKREERLIKKINKMREGYK